MKDLNNLKLHDLSNAETAKNESNLINVVLHLLFFMLLGNGCADTKQLANNSIIVVDINQIHPEKALNGEEEIVSVEIIPLETNDEFLCGGEVVAFTDEIIVYRNLRFKGGEIFLFDRQGKALKKINRQGPGAEEYAANYDVVYDDANKELYVNSLVSGVVVYDLEGNFKRRFQQINHTAYWEMENYDRESLICYTRDEHVEHPFFLISKQTGEKIRDVVVPYKKRISLDSNGGMVTGRSLIKTGNEFILFEPSSDTIYSLNPRESVLHPFLCRTPPIQTMQIPVFLLPNMKVGPFLFLTWLKKEYYSGTQQGYPFETWVYDCRDGKFYNFLHFPRLFGVNRIDAIHESRSNVFLVEAHGVNPDWEKWKKGITHVKEEDNPILIIVTLKE
jgi:hypothetical protein